MRLDRKVMILVAVVIILQTLNLVAGEKIVPEIIFQQGKLEELNKLLDGSYRWINIRSVVILEKGSRIRAGRDSQIKLKFSENSFVQLKNLVVLEVIDILKNQAGGLDLYFKLNNGDIKVAKGNNENNKMSIETRHRKINASEGEFAVQMGRDDMNVYCFDGNLTVENKSGTYPPINVNKGQKLNYLKDNANTSPKPITDKDFSSWGIEIPDDSSATEVNNETEEPEIPEEEEEEESPLKDYKNIFNSINIGLKLDSILSGMDISFDISYKGFYGGIVGVEVGIPVSFYYSEVFAKRLYLIQPGVEVGLALKFPQKAKLTFCFTPIGINSTANLYFENNGAQYWNMSFHLFASFAMPVWTSYRSGVQLRTSLYFYHCRKSGSGIFDYTFSGIHLKDFFLKVSLGFIF